MADSKQIIKLDEKLVKDNLIDKNFKADYIKVHKMLNTHVRNTGKILTEETFQKGDEKLRKWLMTLYKKGASQEKLTSYLRCGLAHLCYDFIGSTYKSISTDDLVTRSLVSFKKRNFNKTFFKASTDTNQLKKNPAIKKKPIKKK